MKKLICSLLLLAALGAGAQEQEPQPAVKGTTYGTPATGEPVAVTADGLDKTLVNNSYNGRVTGTVSEVCQAMGCWFKLKKADGSTLMVKTKDHSFFLPQSLVGKTVAVDGSATVKEISEAQHRHFAEDSGKSKSEIEKIKGAEKAVQLVAAGVKVLD